MILWFHRNCRPETKIFFNFREFRESNVARKLLIVTCSGCDDVLPTAGEYKFLIAEGHNGVIIRDLEEVSCFSRSKVLANIRAVCSEYLAQPGKSTLFANPCFESVYSADKDLFNRVMNAQVTEQGGDVQLLAPLLLSFDWSRTTVKSLFTGLGLAYKKPALAERFFSQFNFEASQDPYFARLRTIFQ